MDKNTIVGLLLIFGVVLGVSMYNSSQNKKLQEERAKQELQYIDTLPKQVIQDTVNHTVSNDNPETQPTSNSLKAEPTVPNKLQSYFYSPDSISSNLNYIVETDKAIYHFSKIGGYLNYAELKGLKCYAPKGEEKAPLILYDGKNTSMNLELMLQNQAIIQTQFCYFDSNQCDSLIISEDNSKLSLRMYPLLHGEMVADSYLEYVYTFKKDDFSFGFQVNFVNLQNYLYPNSNTLGLEWNAELKSVERSFDNEKNITTVNFIDNLNKVDELSATSDEKKDFSSQLKWVSFKQQFFTTVLIADSNYFSSGQLVTETKEGHSVLKKLGATLDFDIKNLQNGSFDMTMYIGPNQYKLLKKYDLNLERQVAIGWGFFLLHWINRAAVIPVFDWLTKYDLSFGLIILIITIILKIILIPFAYKTYMSSAKMRVLKPEIDEVGAKFTKPEDAMKKQQATMALYKSAGVSPMAGCLPAILQMPILIAMFRFFPSAYELRQQPFLWADDLSTYDSVWNFGFNIPFYGDHVSLFCLLMTAATLIYTWMNNKMMTMGNNDQMKMMKVFMYIMPFMFLGIFNSFSSGLTYYYLLVNLITFLQMWLFKIFTDDKKIRVTLLANMKKPQKKSKWQARMEDMVKQQQQKGKK